MMIPGPPALVTIATRSPSGSGSWLNAIARSNRSITVSTRITPYCASSASIALSRPASAPVCDDAARAPDAVRPLFTAMIGLVRVTSRAIRANFCGLPKFSRYMRITRVAGSAAQYSIRSLPLMSALLPTETNWLMPMPYSAA